MSKFFEIIPKNSCRTLVPAHRSVTGLPRTIGHRISVDENPVFWCIGDPTMSGNPVNRAELIIVRKDVKEALEDSGILGPQDVQWIEAGLQEDRPGAVWKDPAEVHWGWYVLWPLHVVDAAMPRVDASEDPILRHDLVKDLDVFTTPEWSFVVTVVSERVVKIFKKFKPKMHFLPVKLDVDGHKPWSPEGR